MKAESYRRFTDEHSSTLTRNRARFYVLASSNVLWSYVLPVCIILGKKGSDERVMIGLFIWTALLMLLLVLQMYIFAFIRLSVGTMKVIHRGVTGLLLVSSFSVFILLQLMASKP